MKRFFLVVAFLLLATIGFAEKPTYEYNAYVDRVLDGDTVDVTIFLGFDLYIKQRIRVLGVDAFEKNTVKGKICRDKLKLMLEGKTVKVSSDKPGKGDKFGRFLARVYLPDDTLLSDWVIDNGYGYAYFGKKKKDVRKEANRIEK